MLPANKEMFSFAKQFSVGFEDLFNELTYQSKRTPGYPPYNIRKIDEAKYTIELALAGFKKDQLTITLKGNQLTVDGQKSTTATGDEDEWNFIYHGIGTRSFNRVFMLSENVNVTGSNFEDGILTINLERVIPEQEKPKLIPIGNNEPQLLQEDKNVEVRNEINR